MRKPSKPQVLWLAIMLALWLMLFLSVYVIPTLARNWPSPFTGVQTVVVTVGSLFGHRTEVSVPVITVLTLAVVTWTMAPRRGTHQGSANQQIEATRQ